MIPPCVHCDPCPVCNESNADLQAAYLRQRKQLRDVLRMVDPKTLAEENVGRFEEIRREVLVYLGDT